MSRDLTTAAQTEAQAQHHTLILMAKFEFGTAAGNDYKAWKGAVEPAQSGASGNEIQLWKGAVEPAASASVFVHTGIGNISFGGDTYVGVGDMGGISEVRETEQTKPTSIDLQLNALNSDYLADALDAGKYGDPVTLYAAYRSSDGTIVADPWIVWSGWFEFASITAGVDNIISVTVQHDLAVLDEKDNSRFTDEDHQTRFAGDLGFEYVHESATANVVWGGGNPFKTNPRDPGNSGGQTP